MSRTIARNRVHKGISAYLRRYLRRFGVSLDEEMAQFALGGQPILGFGTIPAEALAEGVNIALSNRRNLMKEWEAQHPGKNPYPPSFPQRVLDRVNDALAECFNDNGSPESMLLMIKDMCEKELDAEPVSVANDDEEL